MKKLAYVSWAFGFSFIEYLSYSTENQKRKEEWESIGAPEHEREIVCWNGQVESRRS